MVVAAAGPPSTISPRDNPNQRIISIPNPFTCTMTNPTKAKISNIDVAMPPSAATLAPLPSNRFELEVSSWCIQISGIETIDQFHFHSILPHHQYQYTVVILQLEFVQSLASPAYLHYLATSGILYQPEFLDFLLYLRYWKNPKYAKYLTYPHCLYFLDLLVPPASDHSEHDGAITDADGAGGCEKGKHMRQTITVGADAGEAFRREIAHVPFRNFVHEQQFYSWQFRSARLYGSSEDKRGANDEV